MITMCVPIAECGLIKCVFEQQIRVINSYFVIICDLYLYNKLIINLLSPISNCSEDCINWILCRELICLSWDFSCCFSDCLVDNSVYTSWKQVSIAHAHLRVVSPLTAVIHQQATSSNNIRLTKRWVSFILIVVVVLLFIIWSHCEQSLFTTV